MAGAFALPWLDGLCYYPAPEAMTDMDAMGLKERLDRLGNEIENIRGFL